jgi:adenylate kinase family enzyme
MSRILVIGCPGAGKSTLARRIADRLGLPLVHLDREFWQTGWIESAEDAWQARVEELASAPGWVIEGDYLRTIEPRMRRATHVVWLDFARWRCVGRIARRIFRYYGRTRPDMTPGCPERLDWPFLAYIWGYRTGGRPDVLALLRSLRADQRRIVLGSPRAVRAFESGLPGTLGLA